MNPQTANTFTAYLRDQHDAALEAAGDARGRLVRLPLTKANPASPRRWPTSPPPRHTRRGGRPSSTIWTTPDATHSDPITVLTTARTAACRALLDQATPHPACPYTSPFAYGQAIAAIEAARRFYHDAALLDLDLTPAPHPAPPPTPTDPGRALADPSQGGPALTRRRHRHADRADAPLPPTRPPYARPQ